MEQRIRTAPVNTLLYKAVLATLFAVSLSLRPSNLERQAAAPLPNSRPNPTITCPRGNATVTAPI